MSLSPTGTVPAHFFTVFPGRLALCPPGSSSATQHTHDVTGTRCIVTGRALGVPTVALRYFNVYGLRQALDNPYTGAASIFARRLLRDQPPVLFEDGQQTRDLTHVRDVVQANRLAMEKNAADYHAVNVAVGTGVSIQRLAELLAARLGKEIQPETPGSYRHGDVRHSSADISRARKLLGYKPSVSLESGIEDLVQWASSAV